jgi:outer membrane lipoprotein carrier protein
MKKIFFIQSFLAFFLSLSAQIGFIPISESDLIAIKKSIQEKNAQINTLICPFVQIKKMAVLKEDAVTHGMMYFQKTDKFRWEYVGENPFVFVQNRDKYYTKMNGKISEIRDHSARLFQEIAQLVTSSIHGDILENTKKFNTEFQENSNMVVVFLSPIPKALKNFISKIILHFDKSNYLVTKIEIFDNEEDITTILFENVKVNQTIHPNIFELK